MSVLLPEDIYAFFSQSEAPENIGDFGPFACAECQQPIGPNKPEGIADLPPFPMRGRQQQSDQPHRMMGQQQQQQQQQQQPNHGNNKTFFQRGGKAKQQQHQVQPKKITTTVEVSPKFADVDLGTWAKPKPSNTSPQPTQTEKQPAQAASAVPPAQPVAPRPVSPNQVGFNPQKTTAFNPAKTAAPNSNQSKPQATPAAAQQQAASQETSSWGKPKPKPKQATSFASLLEKESSVKPTQAAQAFKPAVIGHPTGTAAPPPAAAPADEKNWPSFSAIKQPKKDSPWGNVKP